jgi:anti-sigma factor RsiW
MNLEDKAAHAEATLLLPWYVNGTLAEDDRSRVDAHIAVCTLCAEEIVRERLVHGRMLDIDRGVEYLPTASLQRFNARLNGAQQTASAAPAGIRRGLPVRRALAASVAALGCVLGGWFAGRSQIPPSAPVPASYRTVTTASSRPPTEVIRAVFAPRVTLMELQSILADAHLQIVSGPTDAGVFSLALTSPLPVDASLEILRRQTTVRFAEAVDTGAAARGPP